MNRYERKFPPDREFGNPDEDDDVEEDEYEDPLPNRP